MTVQGEGRGGKAKLKQYKTRKCTEKKRGVPVFLIYNKIIIKISNLDQRSARNTLTYCPLYVL